MTVGAGAGAWEGAWAETDGPGTVTLAGAAASPGAATMVAGVGARAALNTALKSKTDAVTSPPAPEAATPPAALPVAEADVEEAADTAEADAACATPSGALALTEPAEAACA